MEDVGSEEVERNLGVEMEDLGGGGLLGCVEDQRKVVDSLELEECGRRFRRANANEP